MVWINYSLGILKNSFHPFDTCVIYPVHESRRINAKSQMSSYELGSPFFSKIIMVFNYTVQVTNTSIFNCKYDYITIIIVLKKPSVVQYNGELPPTPTDIKHPQWSHDA